MAVRTPASVPKPAASTPDPGHVAAKKRRLVLYVAGSFIVVVLIWLLVNPFAKGDDSESGFQKLFGGFKEFFSTIDDAFSNRSEDTNTAPVQNDAYIDQVEKDLFPQFEE